MKAKDRDRPNVLSLDIDEEDENFNLKWSHNNYMSQIISSSISSTPSISVESDFFNNIKNYDEDEDKSVAKSIQAANDIELNII